MTLDGEGRQVFFKNLLNSLWNDDEDEESEESEESEEGEEDEEGLNGLKGFSSRLARVERALRPWLDKETNGGTGNLLPEKLVIALKHKYSDSDVSFSELRGQDKMAALVLQNCRDTENNRWLDLHLCVVTKHQYSDDFSEIYWPNNSWIGINDMECHFQVDIKERDELVIAEGEELFEDDAEPYETQEEEYSGAGSTELYYTAVLVIWSKKLTTSIVFKSRPSGALDILERMVAEESNVVTLLHDVLSDWENNIAEKFHGDFQWDLFTSRLLQFCQKEGGLEGMLHALGVLSKTFQYADKCKIIGVNGKSTATMIARAVQSYGWNNMASKILELLKKENVISQCESYSHLSLEIRKLGFYDAALMVAQKSLKLAFASCLSWDQLRAEELYSLTKMLFSFKECKEELGNTLLERLEKVNVHFLYSLVVQIFAMKKNEVRRDVRSGTSSTLFTKICEIIISRDFHREHTVTTKETYYHRSTKLQLNVVDVVRSFCSFGGEELFDKLIQAFLFQSRLHKNQLFLEQLLKSDAVWKSLARKVMGRNGLQSLVNARVRVLVGKREPIFSWHMPQAKFRYSPIIEAFLKGPQESFTHTEVHGLPAAREFARNHNFNGTYQNGFSATGVEGGKGAGAYVVIRKTRAAFDHRHSLWSKAQEEATLLKDRLQKIQDRAGTVGERGINRTNADAILLSPDASVQREKRRRIEHTETIDLTLDDE